MDEVFINKIVKVQSTLKAPKSQINKFGNYNFRSAEDILEAVKPLLAENSLFMYISDIVEKVDERIYIKAKVTVTDGKSSVESTSYAREPLSKKGMDEAMLTGSASSYARKYALNGMFLIDDSKDADTNEYGKQQNGGYKENQKKEQSQNNQSLNNKESQKPKTEDSELKNSQRILMATYGYTAQQLTELVKGVDEKDYKNVLMNAIDKEMKKDLTNSGGPSWN